MHAGTGVLAVVGSVCMTLALVLAWCLAGVRSSRFVKRCFPNPQYLLKAHLDFLMMTGLLFIFFLVFEHLQLTPPMAIVVAIERPVVEALRLQEDHGVGILDRGDQESLRIVRVRGNDGLQP